MKRGNSRQEKQRLQTQRALIAAAVEVFGERGYLETSVEHLLARAGVSRAAFYAQFDSKLALVYALAADFVPKWRPVFNALMALETTSLDRLEGWAERYLEFHRQNEVVCGLLSRVAGLEDRLHAQLIGQRDALIDDLGERFEVFARAAFDPEMRLRARLLLAQVNEACFLIVRGLVPDPDNRAARVIAEQVHAFLHKVARS